MKENIVFIAQSLDGYIADRNGKIDWLYSIPNPDNIDMGYLPLMERIDAVVMGRNTYEIVRSLDILWPYSKHVYVLSTQLKEVPSELSEKVTFVNGALQDVLKRIHSKGHNKLYIDGGRTIQSFLKADLIDEMIITTFPILLGGGAPLFGELSSPLKFKHVESKVFLNAITQDIYKRPKKKLQPENSTSRN